LTYSTQTAIVGAGPAGLSAALEIANAGGKVMVFDENSRPGGQLFKQIHKFFGSGSHGAGTRGFRLGEQLLADCLNKGVEIFLNTTVYGMFPGLELGIMRQDKCDTVKAERILIATGATENPLAFKGWTLPGVMGAGAAQTMININRVLPGKRFLMVGSGNVGLVVSYQILQAGANVAGVIEARPEIGGYSVHACKLRRKGVPFYTSHTIKEVSGDGQVEEAVIAEVGPDFTPIPGTEKVLKVDTVCLAVGLTPAVELLRMEACKFIFVPELGGHVPLHDENMETTVPGVYVAGDVSGIEEASTAMEEGRLVGISIACSLGLIDVEAAKQRTSQIKEGILELRAGEFGRMRREAKLKIVRGYESCRSLV
jgi:thioredoxin reductase